ncbi:MAG: hypothetical protein IH841_05525, partial [Thaumarchaeota archaeon]|nr:hypothetical protein [Nitrososphaerota archaeon]
HGFNLLNIDIRGINSTITQVQVYLLNVSAGNDIIIGKAADNNLQLNPNIPITAITLVNGTTQQALINLNDTSTLGNDAADKVDKETLARTLFSINPNDNIGLLFNFTDKSGSNVFLNGTDKRPIVADFFSFGFINDGVLSDERFAHQIIRFELEETGDNTSTFAGTAEYQMINQVTILDAKTYEIDPIDDTPDFIVIEDETDEDSPRISYRDRGTEGTLLRQGDQAEAPSHSGVVSFNAATYKIASPVTITLQDSDLNTDVDVIDIYTPVNPAGTFSNDPARDLIGKGGLPTFAFGPLGRILDITFDDQRWSITSDDKACSPNPGGGATGLFAAGTTLIETGPGTGVFTANFKIPGQWCRDGAAAPESTTGLDLEVNYLDFRDASGEIIEVGDSAGIRANTGSISLDRTVYPVPFGETYNFATTTVTTPTQRSLFPIHQTGMKDIANGGA